MSTISNLYAAKIFAEHPLALWNLDDRNYFKSVLDEENFFIDNWSIVSGSAEWITEPYKPNHVPVSSGDRAVLSKTSSASVTYTELRSAPISASAIDLSKDTICIASWIYEFGSLMDGYEFGFIYTSGSVTTSDSFTTNSLGFGPWQQVFHTSLIPESFDTITPYIKVFYLNELGSASDFQVMFNNMLVGQWAEQFINTGAGVRGRELITPIIRSVLPDTNYKVYDLDAYGFQDEDSGLAMIDNNKLLAYNTNLPMIYGSNNLTRVLEPITPGMPSLIFPGKGFLNSTGQYFNLTAEFWMRVHPKRNTKTRLFGPLTTTDGLYLNNEFLELRIGKYTKSYFISKWYRPMLVDVRYTPTLASVLINGDVVIEMEIDSSELSFPGENLDWICFYGHPNVYPFEIDCVAIYPYVVPDQVAKRRFIYGQGVQSAEAITNNYDGESFYIDFPFADYTATLNYPDMTSWTGGFFSNMDANKNYLGFKNYDLPEFRFVGETESIGLSVNQLAWDEYTTYQWLQLVAQSWSNISEANFDEVTDIYNDNFLIQAGSVQFFKMKPNPGYNNVNASIEFDTINKISDKVASIHGVFEAPTTLSETPETIMHFYNSINSNVFKITIDNQGLKYVYNDQVLENIPVSASSTFTAGIDIDKVNINYASTIGNFFANPQSISMSLLGHENSTFTGKFYQLTFNNTFFNEKDTYDLFNESGIAYKNTPASSLSYIGNYTFKPIINSTHIWLDISCSGYWEDSIPLSYFGRQVLSKSGLSYYDLDLIQFNIEYPSSVLVSPSSSAIMAGLPLIKTYITLQDKEVVGKTSYLQYTNTEVINANRVLDFDNTNDVVETKFEVVDNTIIFPPKELVDFKDYYITVHIEAKVEGLSTKPFQIRRMMFSSVATDEKRFHYIKTKTGNEIAPISRYDKTYAFKDKNPFVIYQDSTPYLYLTGDSGISLLPYDSNATRAFSIPINQYRKPEYYIGGIQFWGMYNSDETIGSVKKIARLSTIDRTYDFYLEPIDNGKRAFIKAYDAETGLVSDFINEVNDKIAYFQDGIRVKSPIIYPLLWTSIVIVFGENILLDSVSGEMELYEGFIYNNIAVYEKGSNVLNITVGSRSWSEVRISELITETETLYIDNQWEDWIPFNWLQVYSPTEIVTTAINGADILSSYTGTAGFVCNDTSTIELNSEGVDIIYDVVWDTILVKPV